MKTDVSLETASSELSQARRPLSPHDVSSRASWPDFCPIRLQWETALRTHHWDFETRGKLTYFKKHKWRGLFLFEDQMAAKLQKWARDKRRKYMWELGMKQRHYKKCAAMFSKYKRHPFDLDIRQEALALSEHRLTPPDHSLKTLWKIFEEEHVSAGLMQRQYRRLCAARRIAAMKVGVSLMSTTEWKHA